MTTTFLANKLSTQYLIKSSNQGLFTRLINSFKPVSGVQSFGGLRTINITSVQPQKSTETVRLSGPYSMFGPGRVIETVSNTTSFNQITTEYKIIYSNIQHYTFSEK